MEIKDIQKKEIRDPQPISIRTYKRYKEFIKENNINPADLFNKAIEELMKNHNTKPKK